MLPNERFYTHRLLEEKLPVAEVARRVGRSRKVPYQRAPTLTDPHRLVASPSSESRGSQEA